MVDDQGNIIKDAVEDDKTPLNQRGVIQIEGYKYIRTETEVLLNISIKS